MEVLMLVKSSKHIERHELSIAKIQIAKKKDAYVKNAKFYFIKALIRNHFNVLYFLAVANGNLFSG